MNFDDYLKSLTSAATIRAASKKAIETFRSIIRSMFGQTDRTVSGGSSDPPRETITNVTPDYLGQLLSYSYNPKWKEKLPYYDTFPLVIPIEIYDDGFLGLNLHYLPPVLRKQLLGEAYKRVFDEIKNRKKPNEPLSREDQIKLVRFAFRLRDNLMRSKYHRPCIKRYLKNHITSLIVVVPPHEWLLTIMLPTERFVKKSKEFVWEESKMKAEGR